MAENNVVIPGSIGYFLIKGNIITEEQLFHALELQSQEKGLLGQILVDMGFCTEADVSRAIEQKTGCKYVSIEEIEREFGKEVALIVDGVTKIGRLNFSTKEQQQAESELAKCIAVETEINKNLEVIAMQYAALKQQMKGSLDFSGMMSQSQYSKLLEYYRLLKLILVIFRNNLDICCVLLLDYSDMCLLRQLVNLCRKTVFHYQFCL